MKRFFARRRGTKQSLILLAGGGVAAAALLSILFVYPWSSSSPSESPVFVPLTGANKDPGVHTRATIIARGDWEYPPFEFLDESGQPAGFNVDILTRVADIMNLDVRISLGPWDEVRQQLEDGEIDVLAGMYKTDSRGHKVDFSIPHFITSYGVFIPADSDIQSVGDIRDRRIVVQTGDLAHDYLVENEIGAELVTMQEWDSVLSALVEGRADCAVMGMVQGVNLLSQREYRDVRVLSQPLLQRPYCIAVQEGDAELLATLNDGLNLLKTSGESDEIHEKWFGVYDELRTFERPILRVLAAGILALGLVLVLILVWSRSLRKQVHKQTANLTATMQELEAANSAKDRFLASVSHELRTPLHGIIGMGQLMEKTQLDARQSELLEMMNTAASQLYRVISDLIDTSKMNTRQLSLDESTFSLSDLSGWLEPVLRRKAEEKGLALTIAAAGDTKATFRSDKERIAQIVINLADNAIKNTDSGAVDVRLHLHAGEAPETTDIAEAGVLDIVVHDSGSGIPYEEQDKIFAPFKQVSPASGELSPGLGLGLSIVKSITDLLAGSIEVSSTPGEGSSFSVRLPVKMAGAEAKAQAGPGPEAGPGLGAAPLPGQAGPAQAEPAQAEPAQAAPALVESKRILIAEDEAISRLYLQRLLEKREWTVTSVGNGEDVLAKLEGQRLDLILMDLSMPKLGGLEVAKRLRAVEVETGRRRTPIIALTAHAYAEHRSECTEAGMDGFISKPFGERALWQEIERVLAHPATSGTKARTSHSDHHRD